MWKYILAAVLGFIAYPALFGPIMLKFFPNAMDVWVHVYAEYLRKIWGF